MTSRASFRITYDGPVLASHEMDARDLAGALFALGDLLESAGEAIFEGKAKLKVSVNAKFEEGSFGIHLILQQSWSGLVNILHNDGTEIHNAKQLLEIIGLIGGGAAASVVGLIKVIEFFKGKDPDTTQITNHNTVIYIQNNNTLEAPIEVEKLRKNPSVRRNLAKVVSPVLQEGVDKVLFGEDKTNFSYISKETAEYFRPLIQDGNMLKDETQRMFFTIVSISLVSGYKWRLRAGEISLQASINDEDFMKRVESRKEEFANGDILDCDLRIQQWARPEGGIQTTYQITKVYDHIKSKPIQKLPLENPE